MHQLIDKKNKIIIYLLLLFILSTTSGKFAESQNSYFSKVYQINIKGLSSIDNSKISNELSDLFDKYIFLVQKNEIQKIIDKYNIIEQYSVKKIYPSTININIKPTKIVARISQGNQLLVGSNGKLIEDKNNSKIVPYIFGEFDSKNFLIFQKKIKQSKFIFNEFKTLYLFPSGRWDILTNKGILIKLPSYNFSQSLNLAYSITRNNYFKNLSLIDLRVNQNLIIK